MLHVTNLITRIKIMVNKEDWAQTIDYVKKQCIEVAASLIFEFEKAIPNSRAIECH
jgi:hypothetical protein